MGEIWIRGVRVTFRHRDAALVNDDEHDDIHEVVKLEQDALRHREDANERLLEIEFISDDPSPHCARYNTVSDVVGSPE